MEKIRAIIKRPDEKYGHVTNISPTLENLQKTVGGYIEPVSFDGWVILCNENGKNEWLPYNMRLGNVDVLVGTIVVLGTEGEEEYKLTYMDIMVGSDTASALRGRDYRANMTEEQKAQERERARLAMQKTRANKRLVTNGYEQITNVEIEKELEKEIEKSKRKKFTPPTLEEVKAYCKERNNSVDPNRFFDYYEQGGWKDSKGNPVKNWKQKLITWENKETKTEKKHFGTERTNIDFEELKRRCVVN